MGRVFFETFGGSQQGLRQGIPLRKPTAAIQKEGLEDKYHFHGGGGVICRFHVIAWGGKINPEVQACDSLFREYSILRTM